MPAKVIFEIQGDRELTNLYVEEKVGTGGKTEKEFYGVVADDDLLEVPFNKIGNISKIIVNSKDACLRIHYKPDPNTDGSMTIPVNGLFYWSVRKDFASWITNIYVYTPSTQKMDIAITVVGESENN